MGHNENVLSEKLHIHCQGPNERIRYKMRLNQKFFHLMVEYCRRTGRQRKDIKFSFNGRRISPQSTPFDIGINDEQTIYVIPKK